jgi:hypothetical protein
MSHPRLVSLLAATVLALGLAIPAHAAVRIPTKPCGSYSLWATHAASADFWDVNGDRLECYSSDPYLLGRDNRVRFPLNTGYKLYSFGERSETGVLSVRRNARTFTALTVGQEDDADWTGCQFVCEHTFHYDTNDLLYVDYGRGSRRVTTAKFGAALPGATRFSMIYVPFGTAARNVFSVVKVP